MSASLTSAVQSLVASLEHCFSAFIPSQSLSLLRFSPPLCVYSVLCFSSLFPSFAQMIKYCIILCTKLTLNTHFTGLCLYFNAIITTFPGSLVLTFTLKLSYITSLSSFSEISLEVKSLLTS